MANKIAVTVWNEGLHEKKHAEVVKVYPQGIHAAIASHLGTQADMTVRTATLDQPEHGLTEAVVNETDVMLWWGHMAHDQVDDKVVERVHRRVLEGMGLILLHSAHFSKIFRKLMGTTCQLKWREVGEQEVLWVTAPAHPIAKGIDDHFIIDREEMYGEHFDIPEPLQTVFISSFAGGEVFRSGCTFQRGAGKIFYFRPGHETYPTFFHPQVLQVIGNAIRWAVPTGHMAVDCPCKPMGWWKQK